MATLVFSAVGTMVAGPVGGAVGSLVGSQVDAALFGSPNRQGARLKELDVTTSSYGQPIARHFGRMRVGGQMIWAANLVEHSEVTGGGKGAASVTAYSYTASFAVALSSRPILGLGRIWADGKLLRGEAGDLKAGGTLRIHRGTGDGELDPLLAAAQGAGQCPAHRDLAYVVFEDLDLSGFYNHIPSLTFEVIADAGFDLADILGEVIDQVDTQTTFDELAGFTSDGALADALATLDCVYPLDIDCAGTRLVIARERYQSAPKTVSEATRAVGDDEFSAATGMSRRRAPRAEQPVSSLRYYDVSRDYLPGVQHATGRATPGQPRTLELPAALEASRARALVERVSGRLDWSRDTVTWRTAELDGDIAPGACVSFDQMPGRWRVREWEWRDTGIEITAERMPPTESAWSLALPTDPGQAHQQEDLPSAPTLLAAFELPYDPAIGSPATARPLAAVSSGQANWNGAALYADRGDGSLLPLGPSGRTRCVMGRVTNLVAAASPLRYDRGSEIIVQLADNDMQLASATARQLAEGANVALVGEELIQFAQATLLSGGTWRLTGLLRGRGATENGIATHAAGETFVLVDSRLTSLDPAKLGSNSTRRIVAIGLGDPQGVGTGVALSGLTLRPPAPVHARKRILADGTRRFEWTRRARGLHDWRDGVDVPLIEETESYIVSYGPPGSPLAQWTTGQASLDIAPQVHAALAAQAPDERFHVVQKGTFALSDQLDLGPIA
ncbi:phage tail protein [Novosphingobium sp. KA1]|uniref:phage tail protein n=1 Tax=Novosphingobium sp. (strain KA1) TaxID=164608 RepID=UPI001A8E6373|nr:phage tail protein [Novosphingobium sp. KA1]QSR16701.1 hypothetical protein CA833_05790 [Novosphingobium sp. KA1]